MPKEAFYDWSTGKRKVLEVRWAKPTDVNPGQVEFYGGSETFEMIANSGDVTELDRLIAALKRARRAILKDTFVDRRTGGVTDDEASDIDRE